MSPLPTPPIAHKVCTSSRQPRGNVAFTLIELLTVIAILGVLSAILLATLSRVRSAGERATAVSAMRQIGVAIHLFAQDNRGYVPGGQNQSLYGYAVNATAGTDQRRLFTHLAPYVSRFRAAGSNVTLDSLVSRAHLREYPNLLNAAGGAIEIYVPNRRPVIPGVSLPHPIFGESGTTRLPLRLSDLVAAGKSGWLLQESDLECPLKLAGNTNFPTKPVHGSVRHRLYADGSVKALTLDESTRWE
jgi:prepilin-type N-terminal cleavage/methylation domain-containing protein